MPSFIERSMDRIKQVWSTTNVTQRIFIAGLALAVIVAFFVLVLLMNNPDFKVLYSRMYAEDAARVVELLEKEKVDYKLTENGATIMVPEDRVYDLRLLVAGEGGLVGEGVGFEIFDQVKVGQTDFVQRINYQRALQGELSRTIAEFVEIERARVHLVIPQRSLFIEDQRDASASVVLKLKEGQTLSDKQLEAIINLVAMSVEGLDAQGITVADTKGKILLSPSDGETLEGMTTTQLEYKMTLQSSLERRIEEMLYPVMGPGRVIAKVNADLDFRHRTIHSTEYDPDSAVVRSEQRAEETTQGRANVESGVPEANFRGDGINGALSQQQTTSEQRTTNFEINSVTQDIVEPLGQVQRLSVAVIVDGTYATNEETGETTFTPLADEELTRIQQLVQSAVGFDATRGDQIEVSSISFGGPEEEVELSLMDTIMEYAMRLGKPILSALLIFLFLVMVVRPVILALVRPRVTGEMVEGLEGLPEGEERLALMEADEEEVEAMDALKKIDDIKAHAQQLSEQNFDQAVAILRSWMKQQEGVRVG
ncbi:MAG: flagellar M-ring protein FliF [Desulfovibrio sp.]|nr:MAG: flagellar M-ring protein FliF [Desulfovibrio sp.]